MSFKHSSRISSTTSSNTASLPANDETIDPSNALYNDRLNYQIMFSNDSRFFDTSLHLFKSYCDNGYIQLDNKKSKKKTSSSSSSSNALKPLANGFNGRWRPKTIGFSSDYDAQGNPLGLLNRPSFIRNRDNSSSHRSDPGSSKSKLTRMKRDNSPLVISYQDQTNVSEHPVTYSDSSDDPDIIVTRL